MHPLLNTLRVEVVATWARHWRHCAVHGEITGAQHALLLVFKEDVVVIGGNAEQYSHESVHEFVMLEFSIRGAHIWAGKNCIDKEAG